MSGLADRQARLVAALTAGQPVPAGFDASRVEAARVALLRKRAGEVARQWPMLAAGLGGRWQGESGLGGRWQGESGLGGRWQGESGLGGRWQGESGLGGRWQREFAAWAAARPTQGSLRDGWDLARELLARGILPAMAAAELAEREAGWRYDGRSAPKPRRAPSIRFAAGAVAVQFFGRVRVLRAPVPSQIS